MCCIKHYRNKFDLIYYRLAVLPARSAQAHRQVSRWWHCDSERCWIKSSYRSDSHRLASKNHQQQQQQQHRGFKQAQTLRPCVPTWLGYVQKLTVLWHAADHIDKCKVSIIFHVSSASCLASQSLDGSLLSQRNPASSSQTSSSSSPITATQNVTPTTNSTSNTNTTPTSTSTSSSSSSCPQGLGNMPSSKPNTIPPFGAQGLQSNQQSGGQSAGTLGDATSATSQPQVPSEPAERYCF